MIQGEEGLEKPDALGIGTVPHEWLFPQMSAVAHHAGAGTTAAGLRAGVPTVGVPIFTDPPFWASRVAALGAGPQPVPYKNLGVHALSAAISQAVGDARFAEGAGKVSKLLANEDSVAPVAEALRAAPCYKDRPGDRQQPAHRGDERVGELAQLVLPDAVPEGQPHGGACQVFPFLVPRIREPPCSPHQRASFLSTVGAL